jgi:CRP-like cAMP-binding protein
LALAGGPELQAYFPINAALSLMTTMENGDTCESAMIGREGMVGIEGLFGTLDITTSCVVQFGGLCWRVPAVQLADARRSESDVRDGLDRYATLRLIQTARLAACNRLHPIGQRLARWILMLHDRIEQHHLPLSQQAIAGALGVHRPTIALELQRLHATGAIRYRSRTVTIVDRPHLERITCECYHELRNASLQMFSRREEGLASSPEARGLVEDRLTMVSHQLCAHLQAVLGWCSLAQQPDAPAGALAAIERNARAQLPLIHGLMASSRSR